MVDVSRARAQGPKYGPDQTKVRPRPLANGDNKPAFLETTLGKNIIKRKMGQLAQIRKHLFETGEGTEYLEAIYQDVLVRHPLGLGGLQDWASRYALGIIPTDILRDLRERESKIPFSFTAEELGLLVQLLYEERKAIKFWCALPVDKTPEQLKAIKAFELRERDRNRREKERRRSGAKSEIERRAEARKKELRRQEANISRTTEWRWRKKAREDSRGSAEK